MWMDGFCKFYFIGPIYSTVIVTHKHKSIRESNNITAIELGNSFCLASHMINCRYYVTGQPTHSVGGHTSNGRWCLSSSSCVVVVCRQASLSNPPSWTILSTMSNVASTLLPFWQQCCRFRQQCRTKFRHFVFSTKSKQIENVQFVSTGRTAWSIESAFLLLWRRRSGYLSIHWCSGTVERWPFLYTQRCQPRDVD